MFKSILFGSVALLSSFIPASRAIAASGASAEVFDPPSHVRHTPNGEIVCTIKRSQTIYFIAKANENWYITDACSPQNQPGTVWGVIHKSQFNNIQFYSPFYTQNLSRLYNCLQNNQDNAPESCIAL